MSSEAITTYIRSYTTYTKSESRVIGFLVVSYLLVSFITARYVPASAALNPAYAIALCALFFGGVRLWPFVFATALAAAYFSHQSPFLLALIPTASTLGAVLGSYLLRTSGVDPLFRRNRDMYYFMSTAACISLIAPTVAVVVGIVAAAPYTLLEWGHAYVATFFCFLILTPFILRWFAKPRFSRTPSEVLETVGIFAVLIGINYFLFSGGLETIFGIPLLYILVVPLFFITLRLRPRFVTLAFVCTSLIAIVGTLVHTDHELLVETLFQVELLLTTLAISFFIVTSLEEDRRVNRNLTFSQVATLQNVVARVSSESRAKNDFIAILAHELRNPLAPVVSTIEFLQLKGPRPQEEVDALDLMAERMSTVRRLLDDLLDVSRISEGKFVLKNEKVELRSAIKSAILSTDHYRNELHQRVVFKGGSKPLYVAGDAMQIEQVFTNLLTNASKYSHSGDVISIHLREDNASIEIEIADDGVGLDASALESIFLPFNQVEQGERSRKGLGIGLALVRNFVKMHGGTISAHSAGIGNGSQFCVRLPLLSQDTLLSQDGETAHDHTLSTSAKGRVCVLIVDDNDAAAGSMGRLLELRGCSVAYAYDGTQAIQKALALAPDAVLLDVGLPDQDGYEVAKVLRARGFKGRLIALSGYSLAEVQKRGRGVGFDDYLVKPAGLADLERVLPEL